mmetsp:Transcript_41782/g.87695  ORF Transcript_41782/g.87695 Transcript_41782/m.87695 type:complete len:98 (+) Transcript_41782:34-327(+)
MPLSTELVSDSRTETTALILKFKRRRQTQARGTALQKSHEARGCGLLLISNLHTAPTQPKYCHSSRSTIKLGNALRIDASSSIEATHQSLLQSVVQT